jgi:hypothetical protein
VAVPALENLVLLVALPCPDDVFAVAIETTLEAGTDEGSAIGGGFGAWHGEVESESAVCDRFLSSYHARVK